MSQIIIAGPKKPEVTAAAGAVNAPGDEQAARRPPQNRAPRRRSRSPPRAGPVAGQAAPQRLSKRQPAAPHRHPAPLAPSMETGFSPQLPGVKPAESSAHAI